MTILQTLPVSTSNATMSSVYAFRREHTDAPLCRHSSYRKNALTEAGLKCQGVQDDSEMISLFLVS